MSDTDEKVSESEPVESWSDFEDLPNPPLPSLSVLEKLAPPRKRCISTDLANFFGNHFRVDGETVPASSLSQCPMHAHDGGSLCAYHRGLSRFTVQVLAKYVIEYEQCRRYVRWGDPGMLQREIRLFGVSVHLRSTHYRLCPFPKRPGRDGCAFHTRSLTPASYDEISGLLKDHTDPGMYRRCASTFSGKQGRRRCYRNARPFIDVCGICARNGKGKYV